MVIKPDEFRTLVEYYKGNITESSLLNRAARVAAEARLLIEDPHIDPALKEPRVKQLIRERGTLVKELRQGVAPSSTTATPALQDDDDRNVDSLQERMLKGLANSINRRTDQMGQQLDTSLSQRADHMGTQLNQLQTYAQQIHSETPKQPRPKRKVATKKKLTFPKGKKSKQAPQLPVIDEDSWEPFDDKDKDKDWDPDDADSVDDSNLDDTHVLDSDE